MSVLIAGCCCITVVRKTGYSWAALIRGFVLWAATRNLEMSFRRNSCRRSREGRQNDGRGKVLLLLIFPPPLFFSLCVFSCNLGIEIFTEENQGKLLILLMLL